METIKGTTQFGFNGLSWGEMEELKEQMNAYFIKIYGKNYDWSIAFRDLNPDDMDENKSWNDDIVLSEKLFYEALPVHPEWIKKFDNLYIDLRNNCNIKII